jgi:chromosomal replication initiation ATPase DnaA
MELAIQIICQSYNINECELLHSKRGVVNEPINVAIYLTRRLTGDSLKRIADQYQIQKYSSVSSVIERMKAMIAADRILRKRIEDLYSLLTKSQE